MTTQAEYLSGGNARPCYHGNTGCCYVCQLELTETLNKQGQELEALQAERDALRAFAQDCMAEWPDDWCGLDWEQLQGAAVEHGLLKPTEATEPCGEGCWCAANGDFPLTCYRRTELLTGKEG